MQQRVRETRPALAKMINEVVIKLIPKSGHEPAPEEHKKTF